MNWKTRIQDASVTAGHILDDDILEELAAHARSAYEKARAEGCDHDESERYVFTLIDSWTREASELRRRPKRPSIVEPSSAGSSRFAGLAGDVRYGLRLLGRQRAFAGLAIATMALAIGVMTTLSSVAYAVLLKPLPWPEPERLVRLTETHQGATRQMPLTMTNAAYLPWRDQPSTIEGIAAWSRRQATITGTGDTERITAASVSSSIFQVLRAAPLIGAAFSLQDEMSADQPGKVILSYGLWLQRFGGSPAALGQILQLDGKPHVILGVMPRDFAFPDRETRVWLPFYIPPVIGSDGQSRAISMFSSIARLRPGATPLQAAAEATARARSGPDPGMVALAVFGSNAPAEVSAVPALDAMTADVRPALVALFIAVALLLITATANVASLQLARASTRQREIAIRSAIGAGSRRITQQLLIESVLLGLAGGVAGILLAAVLHQILPSVLPPDFPRLDGIALDWGVMIFALALTFGTGLVLGVLPALYVRRLKLTEALMENGTASTGSRRTMLPHARTMIMIGQVAIACTLLIGAVLLSRSFLAMMHADRGFDPANVLTVRLSMPDFAFTPQRRLEIMDALPERVRLLPGVTRAAFTTGLPLTSSETITGFTMPSKRAPIGTPVQVHSTRSVVTDEYFSALGMRMAEGRPFRPTDNANAPKVVIVNRSFAKQYLSDSPIGDTISNFIRDDGVEYEVIGIVEDVLKRGVTEPAQPEIYTVTHQSPPPTGTSQNLVLRSVANPGALIDPLRNILREHDALLTLDSIITMEDRLSGSLAKPRLYAVLLGAFAVSALVIASVGLFGLLSYSVAQRTREIAVRTALGASPAAVIGLVVRQGLVVTFAGLLVGTSVSFVVIQYLTTLLYGVAARDWVSFAAVSFAISIIAAVACVIPAFRAARIDPLSALRS